MRCQALAGTNARSNVSLRAGSEPGLDVHSPASFSVKMLLLLLQMSKNTRTVCAEKLAGLCESLFRVKNLARQCLNNCKFACKSLTTREPFACVSIDSTPVPIERAHHTHPGQLRLSFCDKQSLEFTNIVRVPKSFLIFLKKSKDSSLKLLRVYSSTFYCFECHALQQQLRLKLVITY